MKKLNKEMILKRIAMAEKKHIVELKKEYKEYDGYKETYKTIDEFIAARPFHLSVKYFKRLEIFKGSNHEFDPGTMIASSYNWWKFVMPIKGKLVFNNYRYSPSTGRHQSHVKRLLKQLGVKIDLYVDTNESLSNLTNASIRSKYTSIFFQESGMIYGRKINNKWRRGVIRGLLKEIRDFNTLGLKISKKEVDKMRKDFHDNETKYRAERKQAILNRKLEVKRLAQEKSTFSLEMGA